MCGERLQGFANDNFSAPDSCPLCQRYEYPYRRAVAFASYDGECRELLHLLKYSGIKTAAAPLGQMLASALGKLEPDLLLSSDRVVVTAVPLHRARLRTRGFNQAGLIAHSALQQLQPQWSGPELRYAPGLLERIRPTTTQTGLTNHQRRANLRRAFRVAHPQQVAGRRVILVDDVFTTGTTIAECARTLKRAGAQDIWAATIARVFRFSAEELDRWHFNGQETPASFREQALTVQHPRE